MNPKELLSNPTVLIVGAVVIVAGIVLLRGQSSSPNTSQTSTTGGTSPIDPSSSGATTTNAQGGTYSYLDGSGMEHIIATDPNGNLVSYAATPPNFTTTGSDVGSYAGSLSGASSLVNPYVMSGTPYYSTFDPTQFAALMSTYTNAPNPSQ